MTRQTSAGSQTSKLKPIKGLCHKGPLQISELICIIPAAGLPQQLVEAEGMATINFQGKIMPLMDLRMNLSLQGDDSAEQIICILVMQDVKTAKSFLLAALVESELDAYQLVLESTH